MKQGAGYLVLPDGERFEGTFRGNKFHGTGTWHGPKGENVYEGEWHFNQKDGKGVLTSPINGTYKGEWVKNNKHGQGEWNSASGAVYSGQWENDLKHGKGKFSHQSEAGKP